MLRAVTAPLRASQPAGEWPAPPACAASCRQAPARPPLPGRRRGPGGARGGSGLPGGRGLARRRHRDERQGRWRRRRASISAPALPVPTAAGAGTSPAPSGGGSVPLPLRRLARRDVGGRLSGCAADAPPAAAEGRSGRSRPAPAAVRVWWGWLSALGRPS